jgi:SAM-dependent methyltransferase
MNQPTAYIFEENQCDREFTRLRRIEPALDPQSHKLLTKTGVSAGWACLKIGAGSGSILQWLGESVGREGRVVGLDKKTTYLKQFTASPYEIVESDVLALERIGPFDLIHGRYVLIHNRTTPEILAKLKTLLKPEGCLVLEEPDFESAEWIDDKFRFAGERVNAAICSMFNGMSLDPGLGKRLPWLISRLDLAVIHVEAISHLEPGRGPMALVMADSAEALRNKYVSTGKATNDDVDSYAEGARNAATWANYYSTVGVIAKRA